jgi:hypothetical protein
MADARDRETRKADTLAMLATQAIDVWVATASAAGAPYLVPVSLAWVDERVVIAVEASSVTARNLTASGEARLAVGPTRDVVMIDAALEKARRSTSRPTLRWVRPTSRRPTGIRAASRDTCSSCCGPSGCRRGARRTRSQAARSCATAPGWSRWRSRAVDPTESYALRRDHTESHASRLVLPATPAGCYEMLRSNPAIPTDAASLLAVREASLIRMVRAARQRMLNRFLTTSPPTGRVSYGSLRVATAVRRSAEC